MKPVFAHTVRVYWEDTDAGGLVFFANYLKFFERARTEWLRASGFAQEQLRAELGLIFVVSQTALKYLLPARLDDELRITVEPGPEPVRGAALTLTQRAHRGAHCLVDSHTTIACVDAATLRPRRIPATVVRALTA